MGKYKIEYRVRSNENTCYGIDKVDNQTDAYVIGLMSMDCGYDLQKRKYGNYDRMVFECKDKWAVEGLKRFFGCNSIRFRSRDITIKNSQGREYRYSNAESYSYSIPSKSIESLKKFGIVKGKPDRVIAGVPKSLFSVAVLGVMDADGSIIVRRRKDCRIPRLNIHIVSGAKKIIHHIQRHLEEELNISSSIYERSSRCVELRINNTNSAIKFCRWIYSNLPEFYSHRKKRVFDDYVSSCVSSDELLETNRQSASKSSETKGSETT